MMVCSKCGNESNVSSAFCHVCGSALKQGAVNAPAAPSAVNRQDEAYRAVLGPKNQRYYLSKFSSFDSAGGSGVSWHWPAFFVTFYWLLYRKMWLAAVLYFFLPALIMVPVGIASAFVGESAFLVAGAGYLFLLACIFLLAPMYANALYYKHCQRKITTAQVSSPDLQRQLGELSIAGGTSGIVMVLMLIFGFVFVIGILAAIALPAYQDYTIRARTAQAVIDGGRAADSVTSYYDQYQKLPGDLAQAGFSASLSPSIKSIDLNGQNGVVTVTMAASPLTGRTLLLTPSFGADKKIVWECRSQEIQDKFLPQRCRRK